MKTIVILGASILQLPAIEKAKELGLRVIAVDMNPNAVGFEKADVCLPVSTIDIPGVLEGLRPYSIDAVMTLASDMPMRTVAAVAKQYGLIGIDEDTARKATDKGEMRNALFAHSVPVPRFYHAKNKEEYLDAVRRFSKQCIVKPADNSGSRGIYLLKDVSNSADVDHAFSYSMSYTRNGVILVEEWMEGPEVSVESLSIDGNVHVVAITDKLTTGAPHFVEMGHSQPSRLPAAVQEQIRKVAAEAVRAIGIQNGPAHTEIIVTQEGPKVVELGARLGGDNITTHLTPLSTGIDMVKRCIEIALGEKPDVSSVESHGSAIRYFDSPAGALKRIQGLDEARALAGVKQISFVKEPGETIGRIQNSTDRIGFVIAQADTAEKAVDCCNQAMNAVKIEVEGDK